MVATDERPLERAALKQTQRARWRRLTLLLPMPLGRGRVPADAKRVSPAHCLPRRRLHGPLCPRSLPSPPCSLPRGSQRGASSRPPSQPRRNLAERCLASSFFSFPPLRKEEGGWREEEKEIANLSTRTPLSFSGFADGAALL